MLIRVCLGIGRSGSGCWIDTDYDTRLSTRFAVLDCGGGVERFDAMSL